MNHVSEFVPRMFRFPPPASWLNGPTDPALLKLLEGSSGSPISRTARPQLINALWNACISSIVLNFATTSYRFSGPQEFVVMNPAEPVASSSRNDFIANAFDALLIFHPRTKCCTEVADNGYLKLRVYRRRLDYHKRSTDLLTLFRCSTVDATFVVVRVLAIMLR